MDLPKFRCAPCSVGAGSGLRLGPHREKLFAMNTPSLLVIFLGLALVVSAKTDPATEKELTTAMEQLKQATINKDVALMGKLAHPDMTYSHSAGNTQDRQVLLDYVPTMSTVSVTFSETSIRLHGNVAVIKNVTDIRSKGAENTPNRLNTLYVWVKGAEGWQLLARQPIKLAPPAAAGAKKGSDGKAAAK